MLSQKSKKRLEVALARKEEAAEIYNQLDAVSVGVDAINALLGVANGIATLDGAGKIPASQLTVDAMEYKGSWNASTNSPPLADGIGNAGDLYMVSVAGTQDLGSGPIEFALGNYVIYSGTEWERVGTTNPFVVIGNDVTYTPGKIIVGNPDSMTALFELVLGSTAGVGNVEVGESGSSLSHYYGLSNDTAQGFLWLEKSGAWPNGALSAVAVGTQTPFYIGSGIDPVTGLGPYSFMVSQHGTTFIGRGPGSNGQLFALGTFDPNSDYVHKPDKVSLVVGGTFGQTANIIEVYPGDAPNGGGIPIDHIDPAGNIHVGQGTTPFLAPFDGVSLYANNGPSFNGSGFGFRSEGGSTVEGFAGTYGAGAYPMVFFGSATNTPTALITNNQFVRQAWGLGASAWETQLYGDNTGSTTPRAATGSTLSIFNTVADGRDFLKALDESDNVIAKIDIAGRAHLSGLSIDEGSNASMGVNTLVGGTVVVSNTSVTANSRIFPAIQDPNGGTPGAVYISARTPGVSFTITSTSGADTSIVAWHIVEPT